LKLFKQPKKVNREIQAVFLKNILVSAFLGDYKKCTIMLIKEIVAIFNRYYPFSFITTTGSYFKFVGGGEGMGRV
jgi:hypothetical protein